MKLRCKNCKAIITQERVPNQMITKFTCDCYPRELEVFEEN